MFNNTHFPKAKKFWYKGKVHDWSETVLHPMTHALHYGSSVFEGIRAYNTDKGPSIFRLPEHVDRLFHSASVAKMKVPYSKREVTDAIKLIMKENNLEAAYIRPLLFYSYGNLGLVPKFSPVELIIGVWEWGAYLGKKSETGVCVYIVPEKRVHHSQLDMTAKLGGVYVQSTICGLEARVKGCDEAIFLNLEGRIAEGPGENIFVVKNGTLKTNDKTESVLEGITRASILEIARDSGIPTAIGPITKSDFVDADEVFFSGTAVEIAPIVKIIDGSDPKKPETKYTVGTGKTGQVTLQLSSSYGDIVRGKVTKYRDWLAYV